MDVRSILRQRPECVIERIPIPKLPTINTLCSWHPSFLDKLVKLGGAYADVPASQLTTEAARWKANRKVGLFAGHCSIAHS